MKKLGFVLITPIFILLSHYLAVFPHEYAHSFMAWILGYKNNPFNLIYGGTSWENLLLLFHIDENVNYQMIYSLGHRFHMALIAFAGAGIANGLLFIVSYFLLKNESVKKHHYLYYFLFWFNLMNLGNFYDYVPIRTFSTQMGDTAHFATGLNISPWWIYAIIGYLVAFLIWKFFTKTMIFVFVNLQVKSITAQAAIMVLCVLILFGFFGLPGFFGGAIPFFLSATSFLAIPGIIVALWPTRKWVTQVLIDASSKN